MKKGWIEEIKRIFERKSTDVNFRKKETNPIRKELVSQRIKYFESKYDDWLQISNKRSGSASDENYGRKNSTNHLRRSSYEGSQNNVTRSNMERTPSMIRNSDDICIYRSMDAIYGSFKIREKSVDQGQYEENDVIMRLKVREIEHLGVHRYESRLKAPLSQQVTIAKFKTEMECSLACQDQSCQNKIMSLMDTWNEGTLTNEEKESLIDIALIKSIQRKVSVTSIEEKPMMILELLGDNQYLHWADTELVRSQNLHKTLSPAERSFQESQFELIATEASYYRSLNVLVDKFYNSPLLSLENLSKSKQFRIRAHQKEHLFSNILQIHSISGKFLANLEKRFEETVIMTDICDIVTEFAKSKFEAYIPYIQNQKFQTDAYNELKKNENSAKVIEDLESQAECCSMSLDSFLQLPMQRLLRILLLLKAIKKNIPDDNSLTNTSVDVAIETVESIINQCCAKKGLMDERQRMLEISSYLKFKPGQSVFPISSGTLIFDSEVKCQRRSTSLRSLFSSNRKLIYEALLIFTNEYLLIAKIIRNRDVSYQVEDSSILSDITFERHSPGKETNGQNAWYFCVTFRKSATYLIQAKTCKDFDRWIKELSDCLK